MDLCRLETVKSLMREANINFKKGFGQNFLINPCVPSDIADACADKKEMFILEIGPGIGCLTKELALRYEKVVAVEIDKGLIPILGKTLADFDNIKVIEADILKTDLKKLIAEEAAGREASVCANLPYYITTPVLMYLVESGVPFRSITVMVQKEVAERLCAPAGSSEYGAITAVLGYYGKANMLFGVSADNFVPPPKVDSAVVRIDLYPAPLYAPKDKKLFFGLIKAAFEMRRKTLVNAISSHYPFPKAQIAEALASLGLAADIRGERLSTEDFCRLSDVLSPMLS
ncbi:MAG: 16S rRNA (adenine(1518)-N(6)/adenine(1519)-N(6))-dimethyltransferase RsmA [Clostridia bacterium]|nr:16S rRNA (adenine(1518)-N(6)/adenine(1519)-N(6))-dimethyltransferase RsmA [Clostridia bacterium]